MLLDKLKIGTRLLLIVAGTIVGIVAVGGYSLVEIKNNLLEDRQAKIRAIIEGSQNIAAGYQARVAKGEMTKEEAMAAARETLRYLRYDSGEYIFIYTTEGTNVLHAAKPELEGTSMIGVTDPNGVAIVKEFVQIAQSKGAGFLTYQWPKAGSEKPVDKISYISFFKDWGWVMGTGIYVDDVNAIFMDILLVVGGVALVILLIVVGVSMVISRGITKPLSDISGNMQRLAEGDKSIEVKFTEQKNEIGDLSRAMDIFLSKTIEMDRMREENEENQRRAEEEKHQMMLKMADDFETSVGRVVDQVSSASTEMEASSQSMNATAEETTRQSAAVAAASEQASANVQTVASAAEELSSSIAEISRQVSQSSQIAANAVQQAEQTNVKVRGLADAAQKIGEVVALITDIAEQTNLLALNATIEAARAGDAGKGFAVVASEVKNLANQTAKATDEIGAQISGIQTATQEAVDAIDAITKTIAEIDEVASGIASAVEEQGAATQEIARNVEQAAAGTQEVTTNIAGVSQAANDTGAAATQMRSAASELSQQSETLRSEVDKFLANVRTA